MKKDELVVLRFNTEEDLNKALILPPADTGYYVKVSKASALKIEREVNKQTIDASMSKLKIAMIRAVNALCEADIRLQAVEKLIKFVGFNDDLPDMSSCNGSHEIILVWHGRELNENQIIRLMENKKCIEPSDFIGF